MNADEEPTTSGQGCARVVPGAARLSVTEGAKVLGITRQSLSNLINGKTGVSPEMAIRLSKAFGSTPDTWIKMQAAYDLAQALKHEKQIRVERCSAQSAA
jgi:addiction module HigA family antidote